MSSFESLTMAHRKKVLKKAPLNHKLTSPNIQKNIACSYAREAIGKIS